MSESAELSASGLQTQLEALEIPLNIDPRLLEIWLRREQDEIARRQKKYVPPPVHYGQKLSLVFAAVVGIGVMCMTIILGLVQGKEPEVILATTCKVFLFYTLAGYFTGIIAEYCVTDSVETLLREIIKRSREAGRMEEENKIENEAAVGD
ncbi:MAG: hypothetical protein LBT46_10505 [Planctomycetaceae bacterium]|jgi:hypothetical protein|nr:hypothetical protein [Planctomycetaceae bacterium]